MKELAEMEKINAQLSAAVEEVTRAHREKAEVSLAFGYSIYLLLQASSLLSELCAEILSFLELLPCQIHVPQKSRRYDCYHLHLLISSQEILM